MTLTARITLVAVLFLALAAGAWRVYYKIDQGGYNRHKAETEAVAEFRREANRGRVYQAESKQAQQANVRTKYITIIEKELLDESNQLSLCPLDAGTIGVLNRAALCAREDRPAACGAGDEMPTAQ